MHSDTSGIKVVLVILLTFPLAIAYLMILMTIFKRVAKWMGLV